MNIQNFLLTMDLKLELKHPKIIDKHSQIILNSLKALHYVGTLKL
jgi:hypothetical protein